MKFLVSLALIVTATVFASGQKMKFDLSSAEKAYNLGIELQGKDDLDGALAAYTKALELDHDYAEAYNNRGFVRMNRGDLAGAVADFTDAIRSNRVAFEGYYNRGSAYLLQENFEAALADLNKAIEISPKSPTAYHNRGNAYHGLKKYAEAIADFTAAIGIAGLPPFYYSRAIDYELSGQSELAIADYTKTIEMSPEYARAYANRGVILMQHQRDAEALRDFDKAFQLDPGLRSELDEFIKTTQASRRSPRKH